MRGGRLTSVVTKKPSKSGAAIPDWPAATRQHDLDHDQFDHVPHQQEDVALEGREPFLFPIDQNQEPPEDEVAVAVDRRTRMQADDPRRIIAGDKEGDCRSGEDGQPTEDVPRRELVDSRPRRCHKGMRCW